MTRDLLGLALIAVLCIMISPFYNNTYTAVKPTVATVPIVSQPSVKNTKTIVFLSDTFLPKTFAGSELSGYETLKFLRSRGHTCSIFLKEVIVNKYDGFPIYQFDLEDRFCTTQIQEADIVFFQMTGTPNNFKAIQNRTNPTFLFIHVVNSYNWILQQRISFPVVIVYNSKMTQSILPTHYENMRMIPYVDIERFKPLRKDTLQTSTVVLINCNINKGGNLFKELAYKMPSVQFIGVKGGYADQIIDESPPSNLTYIESQKDIRIVFKNTGILVMPSKNETWGRTAVEAMASGVPVIHSESAGLVECVNGAGIMCMRDDIDAWVEAIQRILGDRAYREQLRHYGFNRVEEINIEQNRSRLELAEKVEQV